MPTYTFKCKDCSKHTNKFTSIHEEKIETSCKHCGSQNTKRIFVLGQRPIFTGSGFYETDYKGK